MLAGPLTGRPAAALLLLLPAALCIRMLPDNESLADAVSGELPGPAAAGSNATRGAAWERPGISSRDGWLVAPQPGQRAYYHVHVPKTAGTSFALDAAHVLPRGEGLFTREACFYGRHRSGEELRKHDGAVVLLRKPSSQVYGQFMECKYSPFGMAMVPRKDREQHLTNFTTWLRHFKSGRERSDFRCYHPNNMQARALSCSNSSKFASHHEQEDLSLEKALKSVDRAFFVGLAENYQSSLCLFYAKVHKFPKPMPAWCDCRDRKAWRSFSGTGIDHHVPPHSDRNLSKKELAMVSSMTGLDLQVYRHGKARFLREAAEVADRTGTQILC